MAEELLVLNRTLDNWGAHSTGFQWMGEEATFEIVAGDTYRVVWDGAEYTAIAYSDENYMPGSTVYGIGNEALIKGTSANVAEPFVVLYIPKTNYNTFFALTAEPHTFSLYHYANEDEPDIPEEPEEPETPEGIVLKDRNGKPVEYYGIETVTFDTTTVGKQQTYTKGTAVEGLEIVPDFSNGDMAVKAGKDQLVKSATIKKPDALVPENIRNGVEVGGIRGTLIGDTEEQTLPLAMADGDMVIEPSEAGKVLSKVIVQKPPTLVPDNIAKGVEIGGVVGVLTSGPASSKAVNFYDVFGNIVYSCSRAQAAGLTELPPVPELDGYEAKGWNKTLAAVKGTVAFMDVGARYTKNGNNAHISVIDVTYSTLQLNVYRDANGSTSATVYWGDGTNSNISLTSTNTTYTASHTYSKIGVYVVGIVVASASGLYLGKYTSSSSSATDGNQFVDGTYVKNQIISCTGGAKVANNGFYRCMKLKYLDSDLSSNYFQCYQCYRLEVLSNQSGSSYVRYNSLQYCGGLKRVTSAMNSSKVFDYGFVDDLFCGSGSNVYFKSGTFRRVIINGTSPGYLDGFAYPNTLEGIYVPDEAVSAYKSNSYWSAYSGKIKALSTYPDY